MKTAVDCHHYKAASFTQIIFVVDTYGKTVYKCCAMDSDRLDKIDLHNTVEY